MDKFINKQIMLFDKIKGSYLLNMYRKNKKFFIIIIKNNKIYKIINMCRLFDRCENICFIINETLKKYKIEDTLLVFYIGDGYCYDETPVFNWALPEGYKGLIFSHFDITEVFDKKIEEIKKYNTKEKEDIYFKGSSSSKKRSRIREKLDKEGKPFNILLNTEYEEAYMMKKHKYLLDLPGTKPWSIRFKYLFYMDRLPIRISFYNKNKNEKSYWKQFIDNVYIENKDYIHLVYETDYDKEISNNLYKKIVNDIKEIYKYYQEHPKKYEIIINRIKKKRDKINLDYIIKYIYKLIKAYTKNIIIMDI